MRNAFQLHQENATTVDFVPVVDIVGGTFVQYDDEGHVGLASYDIPAGKPGHLRRNVIVRGVASVSIAIGESVYANNTTGKFTKTPTDLYIGVRVPWKQSEPGDTTLIAVRMIDAGTGDVPVEKVAENVEALTDSTGGTASESGALVAPASTDYSAAELKANFATIAAKFEEVLDALKLAGIMEEDTDASDVSA